VASLLLGAQEVTVTYRRGEAEMPAFSFEYEHAKSRGVRFLWQTQPAGIISGDGIAVSALMCLQTELGPPDATGRRRPQVVPGTEFSIPCDGVIVALGQTRLNRLLAGRNVEFAAGSVVADPATGQTSNPKYFAGGDCVNGGREVVDAVAEGKRAGQGIAAWLENSNG
jgi:glutamate synthase (NADPH/NADH) small chain